MVTAYRLGAALLLSAAALAFPTVASATSYEPVTLTAQQIFSKERAASGELPKGSYREVTHLHDEGIEWTVTTAVDGEDYRTDYSGAGITHSNGRLHGQRWRADENGLVIELAGMHDDNPNRLAILHPDETPGVKVLGISSDDGDIVIEDHPGGGVDEFLSYDPKTYTLHRVVEFGRDRYRHVTTYDDYRRVYGYLIPFKTTYADGRAANNATETVTSFEQLDHVETAEPPSAPLFQLDPSKPTEIPADFTAYGIIVRATINGKGADFLLDTGSTKMTIDPGAARALGLQVVGKETVTIGGDVDEGYVRIPQIAIGPLTMHDVVFSAIPMSDQTQEHRIVGLIGFDFLLNGITKIDFAHRKLSMYSPLSFDPKALNLAAMPATIDDGVPAVAVWTDGVRGRFLVDTGADMTLAYKNYVDRLPHTHPIVDEGEQSIVTVGGSVRTMRLDAGDMIFSDLKVRHVVLTEPLTSTFDMTDYDGIIGRDMLSGFDIYLDYIDSVIYTKYTAK